MKIFSRLIIVLIALSSTHRAIPAAAAAAAAGGAGARAAYAVPAPLGRRVATPEIVRAMFDHPNMCVATTHVSTFDPDELSPLECALRITSLDFNNREIIDEMIATIRRKGADTRAGGFFTYLNALLATVNYNDNILLRDAMMKAVRAGAPVLSLLNPRFRDLPSVQTCVINTLIRLTFYLDPDDDDSKTDWLHGHEFCFPFSEESSESALMRIRCLGKYITFRPANLADLASGGRSPSRLKDRAGRVLQQVLVLLGSLPATPQTFVYGEQLVQLVDALKTSADVNVVTPGIDIDFAKTMVALLEPEKRETIRHYLIETVRLLKLSPEAIIDHLQLIVQLSKKDTDLEYFAYKVFERVALGFAFGLSQAQIVEVLIAGKLY